MSNRTVTYNRFLQRLSPYIGITADDLGTDEKTLINSFFNAAVRRIWEASPWPEVCVTEARTPSTNLIGWEQSGETEIEMVFAIFSGDPTGTTAVNKLNYDILSTGVYLVGSSQTTDPVYVWYRKRVPDYFGSDYSATTSYTTDDQSYYSTTGDYYKALQASTGNAPTETAYWERLTIPYRFLDYCVYSAYADWLRQDDQHAKAAAQDKLAQNALTTEQDKLERQEGFVPSLVVNTHLSSFDNT